MLSLRMLYASMLFVCLTARTAIAYTVVYDHAADKFTCDGKECAGPVPTGKVVTVFVRNSAPDLVTIQIQITEAQPDAETAEAIKKLFSPTAADSTGAAAAAGGTATTFDTLRSRRASFLADDTGPASVAEAWALVREGVRDLRRAVPNNLSGYPAAVKKVQQGLAFLAFEVGEIDDGAKFHAALAAKDPNLKIGLTADEMKTFWPEALKLGRIRPMLADFAPVAHRPADDFTVTITFAGKNALIPVAETRTLSLLAGTAVRIRTATGLAYSGLVDDHYTAITVVDTPATDTKPAVTHREGRRERRDQGTPELALLIHVGAESDQGYFSWPLVPRAFSFGTGLTTGVSGRLYAGGTWNFGRFVHLTAGYAGGKVKRLSESVNLKNLGDIDPEATRRDVFDTSWFASFTVRLPRQ